LVFETQYGGVIISDSTNIVTGIKLNFTQRELINVFPNPHSNTFNVFTMIPCILKIFNLRGQLLDEISLEKGLNEVELKHLTSGVYLYNCNGITGKITKLK